MHKIRIYEIDRFYAFVQYVLSKIPHNKICKKMSNYGFFFALIRIHLPFVTRFTNEITFTGPIMFFHMPIKITFSSEISAAYFTNEFIRFMMVEVVTRQNATTLE